MLVAVRIEPPSAKQENKRRDNCDPCHFGNALRSGIKSVCDIQHKQEN
jgi:hypothetical protein